MGRSRAGQGADAGRHGASEAEACAPAVRSQGAAGQLRRCQPRPPPVSVAWGAEPGVLHTLATGYIGEECVNGTSLSLECLQGIAEMILGFEDYLSNSFELGFFNLTASKFYNSILGYEFNSENEVSLPLACLDPSAGVFIDYEYGGEYTLQGGILFCGVYGEMQGTISGIGGGGMNITVAMEDFYFAAGNAKMGLATGSLSSDRESDYAEGRIDGKIYIWSFNTSTIFEISDKFQTVFEGSIYQGIYTYDVTLIGIDSSKITDALFTALLSLSAEETDGQEDILQDALTGWSEEGYAVLEESDSQLAKYAQDLSRIESELCDPELTCPTSIYCKDAIKESCISYPIVQNCTGGTGCSSVELVCVSVDVICFPADPSCESNCECLSTVEVCKEWTSQCLQNSSECRDKIIVKDLESCLDSTNACVKEETLNLECKLSCDWNQDVYTEAEDEYITFEEGYNLTQIDLKGFEEIHELVEDQLELAELVKMNNIYAEEELNESGIGPYDFQFKADVMSISIESSRLEADLLNIVWNFYDDKANQAELVTKSKESIISLSGGTLTEDLIYKSPQEVKEENIDY